MRSPDERMPRSLILRSARAEDAPAPALRLLQASGNPDWRIRSWCREGRLFVLSDLGAHPEKEPVAAAVVIPLSETAHELRVLGVRESSTALARHLLGEVADVLRGRGARRLVTATSDTEIAAMALLRESGFRFARVERDARTSSRGWPGGTATSVPARDVVWFEEEL